MIGHGSLRELSGGRWWDMVSLEEVLVVGMVDKELIMGLKGNFLIGLQ